MMRRIAGVATLGLAFLIGCESPTDVEVADLEGTWIATQARYVDEELPKENNTDILDLGYEVAFSSDGTGDFRMRIDDPDGGSQFVTGTLVIDGTVVDVTTENGESTGEVFLENEQVAFSITAGLTFDFKGDGEEIPAKLVLVMDRISDQPTPL